MKVDWKAEDSVVADLPVAGFVRVTGCATARALAHGHRDTQLPRAQLGGHASEEQRREQTTPRTYLAKLLDPVGIGVAELTRAGHAEDVAARQSLESDAV